MNSHPINEMMTTVLANIQKMVDVNTIIGNPVETPDGTTIIPVSKVSLGFGSGGSDYPNTTKEQPPFGGGGGAGISIVPIAFLVVREGTVKLLTIDANPTSLDKMVTAVPEIIDKINSLVKKEDNN